MKSEHPINTSLSKRSQETRRYRKQKNLTGQKTSPQPERSLRRNEPYSGMGRDALVIGCSPTQGLLDARERGALQHKCYHGLDMDAPVAGCSRNRSLLCKEGAPSENRRPEAVSEP